MSRYVALLRGINVGGKNPIKMPELKACFEQQGFRSVVTLSRAGTSSLPRAGLVPKSGVVWQGAGGAGSRERRELS
jgi:hypothetical protein